MATAAAPELTPAAFRTSVSDPREHTSSDLGRLYTVHHEDHRRLFQVSVGSLFCVEELLVV